jgi:hypothetical protein
MPIAVSQQRAVEHSSITPIDYFIVLPDEGLRAFARRPLAVGVLLAVSRLCMRAGGRVPASRADLAAWCNDCATRNDGLGTAIKRAIDDLRAAGLLNGTAEPGAKLWLTPGWGLGRDGQVRPWDWDRRDHGRPKKMSFRKVPIGLLDDYLGICHPDAYDPAQIERWLNQPLLGLADIGAYALRSAGIRVAACFLTRLRHLGLLDERDQPLPPQSRWALLLQAAAGSLTTINDDGQEIPVRLSQHGEHALARKGGVVPKAEALSLAGGGSLCRSNSGSLSAGDDPAPLCAKPSLDGAPFAACIRVERSEIQLNPPSQPQMIMAGEVAVLLDPKIQIGHHLVNQDREIPAEEWFALVALQEECGVAQLLTWQARAAAAGRTQVSPAYYQRCALSEALGTLRPTPPPAEASSDHAHERQEPINVPTPLAPPAPTRPALDADQQAALRELEQQAGEPVRAPWRLAGTSPACIRAWAQCIAHPGLVAYCRKPPIHYAVDQLALGLPPPNAAQLARWAAPVAPGVTSAAGQPAGGDRWSRVAIAELVAQGGGLFSLGSDVPGGQLGGAEWLASPPARPLRAAPAAPGQRPAAVAPAGPRSGLALEPARPPAGPLPAAPAPGQAPEPARPSAGPPPAAPAPGQAPKTVWPPAGPPSAAPALPAPAPSRAAPAAPAGPPPAAPSAQPHRPAAALSATPPPPEPDAERRWSCALGLLQQELPRATFAAWVRGARWGGLADGVATVVAGRADQAEGLRRLAPQLQRALTSILGERVTVVVQDGYVERGGPGPQLPAAPAAPLPPAAQPAPPADPPPAAQPAPPSPAAPSWISPAAWASVPPTLRVALVGARVEEGCVVAASPLFQRVVDRHADVLRKLLDGAGGAA